MDVKKVIYNVFDGLTLNNFAKLGKPDVAMWDTPLIGAARGDDKYFDFLKEHIGNFYWSPDEVFELKYGEKVDRKNLSVVSIVFPQTEETKNMQDKQLVFPSDNWVVSRGEWEGLMNEFGTRIEKELEKEGIRSAFIDLRPEFSRMNSENVGICSKWSHRHTAFAAGMGTFGLSDGFITERGIAIRLASLVVEAPVSINERGDRGPYDWCLFYAKGICGACIKRCPIGAITKENGHDKNACFDYEDVACEKYWPDHIERGNYIFGCGLCQSKVPCRDKRPL